MTTGTFRGAATGTLCWEQDWPERATRCWSSIELSCNCQRRASTSPITRFNNRLSPASLGLGAATWRRTPAASCGGGPGWFFCDHMRFWLGLEWRGRPVVHRGGLGAGGGEGGGGAVGGVDEREAGAGHAARRRRVEADLVDERRGAARGRRAGRGGGRRAGAGTRRAPWPRAISRSGGGRRRRRRRSRPSPRRRGRPARGRGAGWSGASASSALEAVAAVDRDAGAGERGASAACSAGCSSISSQAVLRAQQAAGEERRAGIGGGAGRGADGGEGAAEGRRGVGGEAGDALRRPRRSSAPRGRRGRRGRGRRGSRRR